MLIVSQKYEYTVNGEEKGEAFYSGKVAENKNPYKSKRRF